MGKDRVHPFPLFTDHQVKASDGLCPIAMTFELRVKRTHCDSLGGIEIYGQGGFIGIDLSPAFCGNYWSSLIK